MLTSAVLQGQDNSLKSNLRTARLILLWYTCPVAGISCIPQAWLIVADEQHRFGKQRQKLVDKAKKDTAYSKYDRLCELEISVIDQKPSTG
jgi:hypothetical protein